MGLGNALFDFFVMVGWVGFEGFYGSLSPVGLGNWSHLGHLDVFFAGVGTQAVKNDTLIIQSWGFGQLEEPYSNGRGRHGGPDGFRLLAFEPKPRLRKAYFGCGTVRRHRFVRELRFFVNALRMRFVTHRPIILTHMITSFCDCRCLICNYWQLEKQKEMTRNEIFCMLEDARRAGITNYIIWGGEPLLRNDLPQIVRHANGVGLDNILITNGNLLPERIDDTAPNLYGLIVSLDHPVAEMHDELRGKKGSYGRAIEGIKMAKEYKHLDIFINCVIQKRNIDHLEAIARLAEKLEVKISFELMEKILGYNEELVPGPTEIVEAASQLIRLKNAGLPIVNSGSYLRAIAGRTRFSCQVPKVMVNVSWDGDVRICSSISWDAKRHLSNGYLGNVTKKSLGDIFQSSSYGEYVEAAERCWNCDMSYAREIALINSFDCEAMLNLVSNIAAR